MSGAAPEWVRAWKPSIPGIHEVFHARFVDHRYPPHTHDAWTVFLLDDGAIRYNLEHRHRGAAGAHVTLLPPHVTHDGRSASSGGYRKRVLYVGTDILGEDLIGRAVDDPDVPDPAARDALGALHQALPYEHDALASESLLAVAGALLRRHLRAAPVWRPANPTGVAGAFRDLLDAHTVEGLTLAEASALLRVSPAQLVRCFTRTFGITPHRYLVARRIDAARGRLLDGEPPAEVAAGVGFHDQAHLTRHFRRLLGTTPAAYARSAA
jgi:AraC-like DNA-binding protein